MNQLEWARHVVSVLNRALENDPQAMSWLFEYRVECNEQMEKDSTISVRKKSDSFTLGILGLINGIVDLDGSGDCLVVAEIETVDSNDAKNVVIRFRLSNDH